MAGEKRTGAVKLDHNNGELLDHSKSLKAKCPYSIECCTDIIVSDSSPAPKCDRSCQRCLRRIRSWRVPPNWSLMDWVGEIHATGTAAAHQAVRDFDPARGTPLRAFIYQRVLARSLTRYRQEWSYGLRCVGAESVDNRDESADETSSGNDMESPLVDDVLRRLLNGLPREKRKLIEQLFFENKTETELARQLGISQPALHKRKKMVLRELRLLISV